MSIKLLTDYPVAFITENKTLIISDTHIGVETDLSNMGIRIHKQIEKFKDTLDKLIDLTKAKSLVILGDVKHKVPGASMQELRDIPKFLEHLSTRIKVIITQGNHDDFLETLVPAGVKLYDSKGFKMGKYGFFHGHAWPSKKLMRCDYLFTGHMQPSVEFEDKLGHRSRQQAWLKGKLNQRVIKKKYKIGSTGKLNIIIIPSFNSMLGSMNVMKKGDLNGPLLSSKSMVLDDMRTYLLDGTYLGILRHLRKKVS